MLSNCTALQYNVCYLTVLLVIHYTVQEVQLDNIHYSVQEVQLDNIHYTVKKYS
jgi:hypothetical protein